MLEIEEASMDRLKDLDKDRRASGKNLYALYGLAPT
jgi:hypothetical protein